MKPHAPTWRAEAAVEKDAGTETPGQRRRDRDVRLRGTRPHLVAKVAQAAVALGGSVELCDLRDVEACHELLPDGLAEAVAQRHAHAVPALGVANRLVQEVPADLADVLHNLEGWRGGIPASAAQRWDIETRGSTYGAVVFDAVVPEARGGELPPDDHRHAVNHALTHANNVSYRQKNSHTTVTACFYLPENKRCMKSRSTDAGVSPHAPFSSTLRCFAHL